MTLQEKYNLAKKFVGKPRIVKYADVKDGTVFITETISIFGVPTIGNNYFIVRPNGDVEITNPILCGLKTEDVKELKFKEP